MSHNDLQSSILDATRLARDFALQGNYETSIVGFEGAIDLIQQYLATLQEGALKAKWNKCLEDIQSECELVRNIEAELRSFQDIQVPSAVDSAKSNTLASSGIPKKSVDSRSPAAIERNKRPSVPSSAFTINVGNPTKPSGRAPSRIQNPPVSRKEAAVSSTATNSNSQAGIKKSVLL